MPRHTLTLLSYSNRCNPETDGERAREEGRQGVCVREKRNLPRHRNRFASSVCVLLHMSAYVCVLWHTSAYGTCQDIGIALLADSNHNRLRVVSQVKQHLHTSTYVRIRQDTSGYVRIRQHTSAYVSIRQHTPQVPAEKDIADKAAVLLYWYKSTSMLYWYKSTSFLYCYKSANAEHQVTAEKDVADQHTAKPCIISPSSVCVLLNTSAYVSIRQHTSSYVGIRQQILHALASTLVCVLLYL
jgi:hypothetical protein